MKSPGRNPFSLIIICMVLLLLAQTLTGFAVVFWKSGSALFSNEITFAEADAMMLEIMYANQTAILLISDIVILLVLWLMSSSLPASHPVSFVLIAWVAVITLWSGADYIYRNRDCIKNI